MKALQFLILCMYISINLSSPPCGNSYGQKPCLYLPATPGKTPSCASPGSTFCENVQDYPENLIRKLLRNYMSKDILKDESKIDFNAKKDKIKYNFPAAYSPNQYSNHGPFISFGDYYGSPSPVNHQNDYFNRHRGFHDGSNLKGNGYYYPHPGSSALRYPQMKSLFSTNLNQPDYFRRTTRSIGFNGTEDDIDQKMTYNRFLNIVTTSRHKRQINSSREQLCEVRSNYINPQAALNVRTGNWMYIVNGLETATQLVRTETCISSQCSNLCQLPNGYNSRCEQKYVQKRLVTLDPQGEKLFTDTFWFPSCCVCTLSNF